MPPGPSEPRFEESYEAGSVIQTGVASWYGPQFDGLLTANGEIYDMHDLTAAHRTLPFNTWVRVTNTTNGRDIDVRINDRGPYIGDRVIDLSMKAAEEIDMIDMGTAEVEIQLLEEGDHPITSSNASSIETFTVQLASYDTHERAMNESSKISGSEVVKVTIGGRDYYRVYYGTFTSAADADRQERELRRRGHQGFVKQREN